MNQMRYGGFGHEPFVPQANQRGITEADTQASADAAQDHTQAPGGRLGGHANVDTTWLTPARVSGGRSPLRRRRGCLGG
ncbi:hypothetical protein DPEC_G00195660 [Dallia pectoralis]|uniref:Uncharacterized protein n=1 Tax=Dallia pectoralis TaxID=75939 RepID=A0ACC2G7L7_DALPE|nr:hypothetical protein DPEC_G00195660 [Dallia pectoralis]